MRRSTRWAKIEEDYLRDHYMTQTNAEISEGMAKRTGFYRSKDAISARINFLGLTGRPCLRRARNSIRDRKPKPAIKIYIPKIRPTLKNPELFRLLGRGKSLRDVARVTGEHIDIIRGYISQGGLPEKYDEPVRQFLIGENT